MTLRGPADADTFRVTSGRARRYLDHLAPDELRPEPMTDSVVAMSTIKGAEGKGGLIGWTAKNVAASAVDDAGIWQQMDRDAAVDWLAAAGDRARDKAANRGTDVHDAIERLLDGRGVSLWEGGATEYQPAIEAFVAEWAPVLRYAEVVAFGNVDGDEYAGTLDAIVDLPGLGLRLIDYKSRSADASNPHTVYAGEVAQMGGYATADYLIVEEAGVARRIPMPALDGCALVTFTPDAYVVHPVDLELAGDTFRRLHGWWRGEQIARKAVGPKALPGADRYDAMTKAELLAAAAELDVDVAKSSTKAVIAAAIRAHEAEPVAVDTDPTPPAGIERPAELAVVDGLAGPAAEPDDQAADDALDAELARVDELRRRIAALFELDGGEVALRRRWPADTPGLSDAGPVHHDAIEHAIDKAETDVGAPFDPPPSPPPPPRPTPPAPPSSTRPAPDEGVDAGPDDVDAVRKSYHLAEPAGREWLAAIAGRAGNLSLDERRSERRLLIGWALTRLAVAGDHDDELAAAVIDHAAVITAHVDDPAPVLAQLSAAQARKVSAVVDELVAGRLKFTVSPAGRMALTAA